MTEMPEQPGSANADDRPREGDTEPPARAEPVASEIEGSLGGTPAEQRALQDLRNADVLSPDANADVADLMVRAYVATGGLPSRIVRAAEPSTPMPDLTRSTEGEVVLEGLREQLRDRLMGPSQSPSSHGTPHGPPSHGA
jgi:hypothetical protein